MRNLILGLLLGGFLGATAGAFAGPAPCAGATVAAHASGGGSRATRNLSKKPKAPAPQPPAPAPKSGIVHTGGNAYDVPEALVDRYVSNPSVLANQAAVTQVKNGWKLTSVKSGSKVSQLGLESGDVITTVNGYGLGSLPATWWASEHLKNKDSYRVIIKRDGKTQTMLYRVVK